MSAMFESFYSGFIDRVAAGRNMEPATVREIAEGRVWTGRAGLVNGLIDRIGGLELAVRIAGERAGLDPEETVDVIEYPPAPFIDLGELFGGARLWPFSSRLFERRAREEPTAGQAEDFIRDYDWIYLKAVAGGLGRPLYMIPPELLPRGDARVD